MKGGDGFDGNDLGGAADGRGRVFVLCRYAGMRIWHAAVCIIFGFYLASSSLAPDIANIMTSLFRCSSRQHRKSKDRNAGNQ